MHHSIAFYQMMSFDVHGIHSFQNMHKHAVFTFGQDVLTQKSQKNHTFVQKNEDRYSTDHT